MGVILSIVPQCDWKFVVTQLTLRVQWTSMFAYEHFNISAFESICKMGTLMRYVLYCNVYSLRRGVYTVRFASIAIK